MGGLGVLSFGFEAGSSGVAALEELLGVVEMEDGRMMVKGGWRAGRKSRAAEEGGGGGGGRRRNGGSGREAALVRREKVEYDGDEGWE
jgi:hypothetical protein